MQTEEGCHANETQMEAKARLKRFDDPENRTEFTKVKPKDKNGKMKSGQAWKFFSTFIETADPSREDHAMQWICICDHPGCGKLLWCRPPGVSTKNLLDHARGHTGFEAHALDVAMAEQQEMHDKGGLIDSYYMTVKSKKDNFLDGFGQWVCETAQPLSVAWHLI